MEWDRRVRGRLLTAGLAAALAVTAMAADASAATRPPRGGAYLDPIGDPTAEAGDGGQGGGHAGSGGSGSDSTPDPCFWEVMVDDDTIFPVYAEDGPGRRYSQTGRWLQRTCPSLGAVPVNGVFLVPEGGAVDPRALAADALATASIPAPSIATSPSVDGRLFVGIPTWMWVDTGWWRAYAATARAGRVSSTVSATPVTVTWSTGDGATVTCNGPGAAWRSGLEEGASDCTHTYRRASDAQRDGRFQLRATVTIRVTWTSNVAGGGALPAITRTTTVPVEVGEIQAIGTRGGQER